MSIIGGRAAYPFKVGDNTTGQCSACGEVFAGEEAFDTHRVNTDDGDRACIDPAAHTPTKAGRTFTLDHKGRWHYGEPLDPDALAATEAARVARMRSARWSRAEKTPPQVSQVPPAHSEPATGRTAKGTT